MGKKEKLNHEAEEAAKAAAQRQETMKKVGFGVAIAALVVAIIWGVSALGKVDSTEITQLTADPGTGPTDAPVLLQEYGDFQCPACAAASPIVKAVLEDYGDQVRFEYNDFPLPQHTNAPSAAVAAQCAADQEMFIAFHDMLYAQQNEWSSLDIPTAESTFEEYADQLGLDMTAYVECTTDPATEERVNEDVDEARQLNVNSTPTFFVNGTRVVPGASFAQSIQEAIDEALANVE